MRHRGRPIAAMRLGGGAQDRRVRPRSRPNRSRKAEASGRAVASSASSSRMRSSSARRAIVGARLRQPEQFADDALVHVRVLAQIDRREMEAEDIDRAAQIAQPPLGQDRRAVGDQRIGDDREIGEQFAARRRHRAARVADRRRCRGVDVVERARRRREPGVDAGDRAAIGLVLAVGASGRASAPPARRAPARRRRAGRRATVRRRAGATRRGNGAARGRFAPQCGAQYGLGDERVAVAVAADPAAHAQKRRQAVGQRHASLRQLGFEIGIEPRQLDEEGVVVIGEPVSDLVDHPQPGAAQEIGLPQGQDRAAQRQLRWPPVRPGSSGCRSRSASSSATSISRSIMLLRRTSVGCAVSTGTTIAAAKKSARRSGGIPASPRAR